MIVTPKILARLVAIALAGVLLAALLLLPRRRSSTSAPTCCRRWSSRLGLLGGSMTGAVSGFSIGFLVDCLLVEPLGGASLVLLSIGYLAGLFRERFEIHSTLVPPLLCMAPDPVRRARLRRVQLMLGVDAPVSALRRSRHAAQGHLRLLPRLADLPRRAPSAAARRWSTSRRCAAAAADGAGSLGERCTCAPMSEARR